MVRTTVGFRRKGPERCLKVSPQLVAQHGCNGKRSGLSKEGLGAGGRVFG